MEPKLFVAMKAFVLHQGKVLLVRESGTYADGTHEGIYGLPGGRMKPGEHFLDSLYREVKEETGLTVKAERPLYVDEWRPVVRGEQWQIVGMFLLCSTLDDRITLGDEHDDYIWIDPATYTGINMIKNEQEVFRAYFKKAL